MDIRIDDLGQIKVGDTILPGVFESVEVEDTTKQDEVEIEGQNKKATQATEYEPTRVRINLTLLGDASSTPEQKLAKIRSIYRPSKAVLVPKVYRIVCDQVQAHGMDEAVFIGMSSRGSNLGDTISVTLEFMEHISLTVQVTKTLTPGSSVKYTVRSGDTLGSIARKYGTTVQAIVTANNIADANTIYVGQVLTIPSSGSAPSGGSSTSSTQTSSPGMGDLRYLDNQSAGGMGDLRYLQISDDETPPKWMDRV